MKRVHVLTWQIDKFFAIIFGDAHIHNFNVKTENTPRETENAFH